MRPFLRSLACSLAMFATASLFAWHGCDQCSIARSEPLPLAALLLPPSDLDPTSDVIHYQLSIDLDIPGRRLVGRCVIHGRSRTSQLNSIDIRISNAFTVVVIQNERTVTYERLDAATIRVPLDRTYKNGEAFAIEVAYQGVPPQGEGFGSILFTTKANGMPHVSTLSEPWFAYTWWPAKDVNTDKATIDLEIGVPPGLSVAANGLPSGTTTAPNGLIRHRFVSRYRMAPYLVAFSVADYNSWRTSYESPNGTMPLDFMIYPEHDNADRRALWERSRDMLAAFRPIFGEYPFLGEKYGIYQFGFGGGMEHQTMSGQGGWGESLTAHELAHQWWGDLVTCETWSDIWLNEGFATYSEALWAERQPGSSGLPALKSAMQSRRPGSVDGTVYIPNPTSVSRIFSGNFSYRKAGWVLHMLRKVVGDATFFAILAEHRARHAWGTAATANFIETAEQVAARDLSWFFDPWLFQPGAPSYRWGSELRRIADKDYLLVSLEQRQNTAWPTFAMPVGLRGTGLDTTLWNSARTQHYAIPVAADPGTPTLDPDGWVLNTGIERVAYAEGPPVIVGTSPRHFDLNARGVRSIAIDFTTGVVARAGDFAIVGSRTGSVKFGVHTSMSGRRATLSLARPLQPDTYRVTVRDSLTGLATGWKLDGENLGAWPSGDGLPGGSAEFVFLVKSLR